MIARLKRSAASLAMVVAVYWVYTLVAVPLIEPSAKLGAPTPISPEERNAARNRVASQREDLRAWFTAGDWELTSPKVLETARGKLLLKDYHNRQDGLVEIRPCTMIFLPPEGTKTTAQRQREAIVLQAPEGAILRFDQPLDLARGQIGNIVAGKLRGRFTIRSGQKSPGPEDDLWIVARDAELIEHRVVSPHPIEFRLGPSYGSGRDLRIDLATDAAKGAGRGPSFSGINNFQLQRDVVMHLDLERGGLGATTQQSAGGESSNAPPDAPAAPVGGAALSLPVGGGQQPPLRISCTGPFQFDLIQHVATFHDQVDVLRLNPQGQSDHLQGDLLSLFFAPAAATNVPPGRMPRLEPSRLEVHGSPVVMQSPEQDVDARGELLRYDLKTRRVSLEGSQPVKLRQGINRIEAPKLFFEPSATSRWGRFSAIGPGSLDATPPDDPSQHFRASWTEQLHFGPDQTLQLISLVGQARFEQVTVGALEGQELHVWLREAPSAAPPAAGTAARRTELVPERMQATGSVRLESQQLTSAVEKLQVWFLPAPEMLPDGLPGRPPQEELPMPGSAGLPAFRPGLGAVSQAAATAPLGAPAAGLPRQRMHVTGKLLQVELRMRGRKAELSKIHVQEQVQVKETVTAAVGETPLVLVGDQLDFAQTNPADGLLSLVGAPAHVEGRGLVLDGPAIRLNRGTNELLVEGAGAMQVPVDQDAQGHKLDQPRPLEITWRQQMQFDGRLARFENDVVGHFDERTLRTQVMEVTFADRVDFANPPRGERPDVAGVTCRGGVSSEGRSLENGMVHSVERMQVVDLTLNRRSGAVTAQGPGWMTLVRRGAPALLPGVPGAAARPQPPPAPPAGPELTYLKIEFQRLATGNLNRREMQFGNHVRTTYGPVAGWEGTVNADDFDRTGPDGRPLGQRGVFLTSDTLAINEAPTEQPGRRALELDAAGNAVLEGLNFDGQSFYARAAHMKYAEAKDLVILEGDGRVDAELTRQERVGAPFDRTLSRKIHYWVSTRRVYVDDAQHFDLNLLSNPRQARAGAAVPQPR